MAAFHFYIISLLSFVCLGCVLRHLLSPSLTPSLPPILPPSLPIVHEKSLLFPLLPAACVFYIFGDPLLGWWLGKGRREGGREGGMEGRRDQLVWLLGDQRDAGG